MKTTFGMVSLVTLDLAGCANAAVDAVPPTPATAPPTARADARSSTPAPPPAPKRCVLIETDDDIPSGSPTAGALFVPDAELGKKLLTADVVAVAKGFLDAGVSCVKVIDSHDGAVDPEPLRAIGVSVVTPSNDPHWTWPFFGSSVESASVAALVGYHSRADQTTGFRPHTINDSIRELKLNGVVVGEVTHELLGFGAFDVPVVLVTGDANATAEAAALVPAIEQVTVRWRDAQGEVRFLPSEEAAQRLRAAARRAAVAKIPVYRPTLPAEMTIRTYSRALMTDRSGTLPGALAQEARQAAWDMRRLGDFDMGRSLRVQGDEATWTAPNALAAYVSIASAASYLSGPNDFELRARGYEAYKSGQPEQAVALYLQALQVNPYDIATHCRLGAAYQKLGRMKEARQWFGSGVEHDEEVGDLAMKSWCALGLAQTELAAKNLPAARKAAERVLGLPDIFGRHGEAKKVLAAAGRPGR